MVTTLLTHTLLCLLRLLTAGCANWAKIWHPNHRIAFAATFKCGHFTSSSSGTIWIQMHLCMIFAFDLKKTLSWWLLLVILITLVLDECWARESKNKADRNNHCEHKQDKPICRIHLMSLVTCVLESWAINADKNHTNYLQELLCFTKHHWTHDTLSNSTTNY